MSVQLNLFIWSCTCVENGNNQTKVFIKYILQYSIALGQFSSVISKRYTELKNNEMSENLLGMQIFFFFKNLNKIFVERPSIPIRISDAFYLPLILSSNVGWKCSVDSI